MAIAQDLSEPRIRDALAPGYRLERKIGAGGMATVYLAYDVRHDRNVAIKVMRRELATAVGAARFLREIRLSARLTHPNILPLLDSGTVDDAPYFVMPFVEGESLRGRLDRADLPGEVEALALIHDVADALDYAHAAGIVHRDIKPENILLLGDHAIVADFGIARAMTAPGSGDSVTTAGIILGTPAYMSPEQAAGEEQIDGRSDIYSLATVLFEVLSGTLPFSAKTTQGLIARRFVEVAPRLATRCAGVSNHIDAAVAAALALDPADRPPTATAFAALLQPATLVARAMATKTAAAPASADHLQSIAVLPFANLSSDPENEYLSDGISEEIMGALGRLRTLRVAARASSFAFKGRREDVRAIARQLGVTSVLDGSVRRAGSQVRVSAQLVDAITGFELWSDQFDHHIDNAFEIQTEVARAIATALRATLLDARLTPAAPAVAGEAYETYLRGRYALNKRTESDVALAASHFEDALTRDPAFALGHAGLADALLILGVYGARQPLDVLPRARAAAERALQLDPSLPEPYSTRGAISALFEWDWLASENAFRRAISLGPRNSTALQRFALDCLLPRARFAEARMTIAHARALDPLSMVVATSVGVVHHLSGDPRGAVRAIEHTLELDANFAMAHYFLGGALRDAGDYDGAASAFKRAANAGGATPEMTAGLALTLALGGDVAAARRLQHELTAVAEHRYVSPCLLAQLHVGFSEYDAAFVALDRACALRDPELVYLSVRPAYTPLAADPRFVALRGRVGV